MRRADVPVRRALASSDLAHPRRRRSSAVSRSPRECAATWTLASVTTSPDPRLGHMTVEAAQYVRYLGWAFGAIGKLAGCSRQTVARALAGAQGSASEP
ncbi:MAG: hypothetical protein ACJATT_003689 [Myxococcota bacterium]|jgi:hypothetical protein